MTPHFVDFDGLREKCIQLYSIIKAGCPPELEDWDPLSETFAGFYRYNISLLLLEIASRARVLDDVLRDEENDCAMADHQHGDAPCRFEKGGDGPLKLREIANKVLHAKTVELVSRDTDTDTAPDDDDEAEERSCRAHTGIIRLHGSLSGKDWTVALDPVAYCREILGWLSQVEDEGRLHKIWQ